MSKIKVSKEVGKALNMALKTFSKEDFFRQHTCEMQWKSDIYLPLNQISNWEMAQILINGYEVEETLEKKVLAVYKALPSDDDYDCGRRNGIKEILNVLDIKIKGIND